MSYLEFDKQALVNLEYSLSRETIRTNRGGSFACSTIVGCNTRKYHGLLICPLEDGKRHVLLSSLDVSVIQQGTEFQLGIHKFPGGLFMPKGHMYVRDFDTEPIPKLTYRIGDTVLSREILLVEEEEKILARFTLIDSQDPIRLKMTPFLAFREIHKLSKANMEVNSDYETIEGGIKFRLYDNYPNLYLQCSKASEFVPAPDWYYNIEYIEEQKRGYDYQEDLFVNGYFEVDLKKGESFIFSAGLQETPSKSLKKLFDSEIKKRIPRDGYENCLLNSAQQFLVRNGDKTDLIAGYPWFGQWARDTFIALPGLTIAIGDKKSCKSVLDTTSASLQGPLFYNVDTTHSKVIHHSADAPLWYFWAIQKYAEVTGKPAKLWETYGDKMKIILYGYRNGTAFNIHMTDAGLIYAGVDGEALTWMDSVIDDKPVTPRVGMPVEINALWYNAVAFSLELARAAKDEQFMAEWEYLPEKIKDSFVKTFWSNQKRYLADCVRGEYIDWSVRPNQVFAVSLPYSPLDNDQKRAVLNIVESDLLTPKGLRTLSPKHPDYRGIYGGSPEDRDTAYHQGTVWPWLLGHFCEAYLKLYKKSALDKVKSWYHNFEDDMRMHGIGSISEIYDGNPPYRPNGAISQAWSVGEVLRIRYMIQKMEENT
ncbi:MAG: amylo-alpha-1,6-glucosidase [Microscillaceae bacterium]|nr:amylo-alpha-1,6-glucosidase [Microscillaceae bacterium]